MHGTWRRLLLHAASLFGAAARVPSAWLDWPEACSHVRSVDAASRSNFSQERLIEALAEGGSVANEALHRGAERLRVQLSNRNVLCNAAIPCDVTEHEIAGSHIIRACLPEGAPALSARLCDPWGLDFQQEGGVLAQTRRATTRPPRANTLGGSSQAERLASGLSNGEACVRVNLTQLAEWWSAHRTRRPFLWPGHPRLAHHLDAKAHSASKNKAARPSHAQQRALERLLNASASDRFAPQSLRRCAFVGSGHDLRCGEARGREIDTAYDAVFRANAAQQLDHPHQHYISAERAGGRTDFRTNCLFNSTLLPSSSKERVCIIPRGWWRAPWGRELTNNAKNMCCEKRLNSLYAIETLQALAAQAKRAAGSVTPWVGADDSAGRRQFSPRPSEASRDAYATAYSAGYDAGYADGLRGGAGQGGGAEGGAGQGVAGVLGGATGLRRRGQKQKQKQQHEQLASAGGRLGGGSHGSSARRVREGGSKGGGSERGGPLFVWLDADAVSGAGEAFENMMHSTGGNTLVAATALCDQVDVFGAGLFSTSPSAEKVRTTKGSDRAAADTLTGPQCAFAHPPPPHITPRKVYNHNYDSFVSSCVVDPKSKTAKRPMLTHSWAFKWLKQRLADELTMHILHAFGVLRWRT